MCQLEEKNGDYMVVSVEEEKKSSDEPLELQAD